MRPHAMALMGSDPSAVKGRKIDRALLRRVLSFAGRYRAQLVGFVSVIALGALLGLVPPLLFRSILDDAIPSKNTGQLTLLAALVIAAAIGAAALSLAERWWSARIGEGLIFDLRVALFDHVQRMPVGFFTRTQTGALVSRLNNDVIGAQRALTGTLGSVVSNMIVLATTLAAMIALDWRLTLIAVLLLPFFLFPARRVGRRISGLTREGMDVNASMNTTMTERFGVAGATLVKLFGNYDTERTQFASQAGRVRDIGIRTAVIMRVFMMVLTLVGALGAAAVYLLGGRSVISGAITTGTLVAMATLVTRIYDPLTQLTNTRVDVMSALVSFERVFEVLDTPNPLTDAPDAVELTDPQGRVRFDRVSFSYQDELDPRVASLAPAADTPMPSGSAPEVLHEVSAVVEPGWTVALVGPSGAGKSTLASLVNRLHDVKSGSVSIDGVDVRHLSRRSITRAVGVVSQDPHLFHATVGENLTYARPDATTDELREACRAAQVLDVIERLPHGFDTVVGERGYRLSGGEKQRVAIARMLLADPAIVILDEATSHLDTESESLVQAALHTALSGRTAIVIAHRLSTIVNADHILVLDKGHIVEEGTHRDLVAHEGLYAELYRHLGSPIGGGVAVGSGTSG